MSPVVVDYAVSAAKPLNEFQLEVLRWIAAGCPERGWPNESHKHSARALQSRGLAHVARRQGVWVAEITEAGRHYVAHGDYSPGVKEAPRLARPARPTPAARAKAGRVGPTSPAAPGPPVELGPSTPTEGQWLLLRLLAAGGRLEVDTRQTRDAFDELRAASYLPPGQVLKTRGRGWCHQLIYLCDDPRAVVPEREIQVPSRLTRPHPVARAYRDDRDRHEVSASALARATRLVHVLASTLEGLGYDMRRGEHTPDGQLLADRDGAQAPIRISEKSAPGGAVVPRYNPWGGRPLPAWQARRQTQFIPTGQLTILVGGQYGGGHGRRCRFNDTKARPIEELLPLVVREVEMRFFERRQDQAEDEREDREQEQRWQAVLADAQSRAIEAFRADVLAQRATAWRVWHEQVRYVNELADHLMTLPNAEQGSAAEWLTWARSHLETTQPFQAGQGMPQTPEPTKDFLEPHIRGWAGPMRSFRA